MKIRLVITLLLILCFLPLFAQNENNWEEYYQRWLENNEQMEETNEEVFETLAEMQAHPINLNTATREDLERLPFLTAQQVESICEYLYHYAPMRSVAELALIEAIDYDTRLLLQCFVYIDDSRPQQFPSLHNILKYGKHELAGEVKFPLTRPSLASKKYLGYDVRHWLRYDFHLGDFVKAGLLAAQDAGEPFFSKRNRAGYDFYSLYFLVRKLGRIQVATVGRYRLRFGMGLVVNNDYGFGKQASLATLGRTTGHIRSHSSRSEGNYLQGMAATVNVAKGLDASAFASYRYIDVTPTKNKKAIKTLLKTGYHRTITELQHKHNALQGVAGANLNYARNGFHIGMTALYTGFNNELQPDTAQHYKLFSAQGKQFYNVGLDYGYLSRRITFAGETAIDKNQALATINMITLKLWSRIDFVAIQRFYSYRYQALLGRSFSEGGHINNESGLYLGANWQPARNWLVTAYTDYAYFALPRYRVSTSSFSWDNMFTANYTRGISTWMARYRFRLKQENATGSHKIINKKENRVRLAYALNTDNWHAKIQADGVLSLGNAMQRGWMTTINGGWQSAKIKIDAVVGYFNTNSFDSRIYTYERGLRYNFSFPSFFGQGYRTALIGKQALNSHILLLVKLGYTHHFSIPKNKDNAKTNTQKHQADADLQLIWKF